MDIFLVDGPRKPNLFVAVQRHVVHHVVVGKIELRIPTLKPREEQQLQVFPVDFTSYGVEFPQDVVRTSRELFIRCSHSEAGL
jgi:hypothetical protein